jgi:hypothetical protein
MNNVNEVCATLANSWSLMDIPKKITAKMSSDGQSYTICMTVNGGALKKSGAIKRSLAYACNTEHTHMVMRNGHELDRDFTVADIWHDHFGKCSFSPIKVIQTCVGNGSPAQTVFSITVHRAQQAAA